MHDAPLGAPLGAALAAAIALFAPSTHAGPLTPPPGPPTSTLRTLDQVEPRTEINSLPGALFDQHVINAPGSYYLTGNLTPNASVAINVTVPGVVIDLNGFEIDGGLVGIRMTASSGTLTIRNGTIRNATGIAIDINDTLAARVIAEDLVIENCDVGIEIGTGGSVARCVIVGTPTSGLAIEGAGSCVVRDTYVNSGGGIFLGSFAHIERVRLTNINADGIRVGNESTIADAVVFEALGDGIEAGERVTIRSSRVRNVGRVGILTAAVGHVIDSTVVQASFEGIRVGLNSRVERSAVEGSGFDGIEADNNSIIIACFARTSASAGYNIDSGSIIHACIATSNGSEGFRVDPSCVITDSIASSNGSDGFDLESGSIIRNSIASSNGTSGVGAGIRMLGRGTRIDGNTVRSNPIGIELPSSSDSLVVRNYAVDNTTNYFNIDQPIVTPLTLDTASPWANISE